MILMIVFIGLLGILFGLGYMYIVEKSDGTSKGKVYEWISEKSWIQTPFGAGLTLLLGNFLIFSSVVVSYFIIMLFHIPFAHLFLIFLGTWLSIMFWILMKQIWFHKIKTQRIFMSLVGSSFYLLLFLFTLFQYWRLEPTSPNDDIFMAALGMLILTVVSFTAFIICFLITGITKKIVAK